MNTHWQNVAQTVHWHTPWHTLQQGTFAQGNVQWFVGGQINAAYNCLDRHLPHLNDAVALYWQSDDGTQKQRITYGQLHAQVCQLAHALQQLGVTAGESVSIYLPMIPQAVVAMLACARIGAIHSVVFGGFSAQALHHRLCDANSKILITADAGNRGGKVVPLKQIADEAVINTSVQQVIVVQHTSTPVTWHESRDMWWHDVLQPHAPHHTALPFAAEHPLFMLYTSGSTGKPKGILHTTAGYMAWATYSFAQVFDYQPHEVYFSTADVGWITGHTYGVYGPLSNGATVLMFEGVPTYPHPNRWWQLIDEYAVNIFYTAPTALRALMREGDSWLNTTHRNSLRVLGSVGEPINPAAWQWYYDKVGHGRAPIVDTWWQTETGGILIAPLAGKTPLKAGSATLPLQGIVPALLDDAGQPIVGAGEGALCIQEPWPSMARSIYNDHARYISTYFAPYAGYYCTGDRAQRDENGYYTITGRMDDVLNVSGHRLGTAEIESALVAHEAVAEAAVIGIPHDIKGECVYAYVMLKQAYQSVAHDDLPKVLQQWVRQHIGAIAMPEHIHIVSQLPKTRSGKIMRRILRKIATKQTDDLGDLSTLVNPEIVAELLQQEAPQRAKAAAAACAKTDK